MTGQIPKAELHCHFEGTAAPRLIRKLAARNSVEVPPSLFDGDDRFAWTGFPGFLDAYDLAARCIRTVRDYRDVSYEYLAACAHEGAIYVEVFLSPDHAAEVGLSYAEHLAGAIEGIKDAERDFGIVGRIIITCVRHFGPDRALKIVDAMVHEPHPYVVGFGMAGNELIHECRDFTPVFAKADAAGFPCTVHAGEVAGAESIRAAIDALPVHRIGHGVRAVEDPALVAELAKRGLLLEVCPGSNIAVGIYPNHQQHPLPRLLAAGCRVTLNSDDPPYFDTSIGREYARAAAAYGFDDDALLGFTRTAIEGSFADDETRAELLRRLDNFMGHRHTAEGQP